MSRVSTFMCSSLFNYVESKFQPIRSAQFVENPKQIIADRMLGQAQLTRNVAVGQAFGHQSHQPFFPLRQQISPVGPFDGLRSARSQSLNDETLLIKVSPDLASGHGTNALAQHLKSFGAGKYSIGPRPKPFNHQGALGRIDQHNDTSMWIRSSCLPHQAEARDGAVFQISTDNGNVGGVLTQSL